MVKKDNTNTKHAPTRLGNIMQDLSQVKGSLLYKMIEHREDNYGK